MFFMIIHSRFSYGWRRYVARWFYDFSVEDCLTPARKIVNKYKRKP